MSITTISTSMINTTSEHKHLNHNRKFLIGISNTDCLPLVGVIGIPAAQGYLNPRGMTPAASLEEAMPWQVGPAGWTAGSREEVAGAPWRDREQLAVWSAGRHKRNPKVSCIKGTVIKRLR